MVILPVNGILLQYSGLWQPTKCSLGWKISYNIYTTLVLFIVYSCIISELIQLMTSKDSIQEIINKFVILLSMIGACVKTTTVLLQPYAILFGLTTIMISAASLCTDAPNGILPYKAWYPYDTSTSMGFWSAYLHQIIAHFYGASTNAACDTLIYGMIRQICAQFTVLQHRFHLLPKSLVAIGKNVAISQALVNKWEKDELRNCIRHHLQILHYADECNRLFDFLICLQFLISSTVLCVSIYRLAQINVSSPDFPLIMMYLMCMLSQIFILCVSGSHVMFESHNMVHGIYAMDWTSLTPHTKKSLILIIGKCLRPVTFTCGTIVPLSIYSFNQLIKLSYSAFNVLQRSSGE